MVLIITLFQDKKEIHTQLNIYGKTLV
jgi:hypothetical protein